MRDSERNRNPIAEAVNEDRLWQRLMEMARIGGTSRGGVTRETLTPEDAQARALLIHWAEERGFGASSDAFGNLLIHRPGSDPSASPVVTGSHLDSQPSGGKFDGALGVLAGFEVLEALEDANIVTRRPLAVASWTNEEGSRFQPPMMGSAVFTGALSFDAALQFVDRNGVSVAQALDETLKATGGTVQHEFRLPMSTYVEVHIEQGPILERTGSTIGIVTGIQGQRWFTVEVHGEAAHAGTTPRQSRKDALSAAVRMVTALEEMTRDETDTVRFTVGRFDVSPNSPNIVPSRVLFTIDIRHPENGVLSNLADQVEPICMANAGSCGVTITETLNTPTTLFDGSVMNAIREAASRLNLPHMDMISGAGHDAKSLADFCPTGMIFVPCERGISHSEAEKASPADLAAGTRVLAEVLVELAGR